MNYPSLIALYSPAPQSGKSTVAKHLEFHYGYTRVPFASILKEMARPIFFSLGYSLEDICEFETTNKERMLPEIGVTPRRIYQTLGTEWGRMMINNELWIKLWEAKVSRLDRVVVDDMRFPNEYDKVKALGGLTIKVQRDDVEQVMYNHVSEGSLNSAAFDYTILNNRSLSELHGSVESIIESLYQYIGK